ncbi:MAG: response regulator transcription factor [Saprospiraceae bacterium]|nr:response regulator transcription factor [Saprospiraceae bacterium]
MSSLIVRKVVTYLNNTSDNHYNPYEQLLTNRERENLNLLSKGFLHKQIASELFISTETVKTHCHNIYEKLHVTTKKDAVNKYYQK